MPRKPPKAPVDNEGCLVLRGELLWKWRALDAEIRNAILAMADKQREIDAEIAKNETLKTLIGDKHGLVHQHAQHVLEMKNVHAEMEKILGVDIKDISIDDKTGRVHVLDKNNEPMPLKPKKTKATKGRKK